jgi:ribosome-associated protein
MDATARSRETALAAARCIDAHKGEDTVVLEIGELSTVADYFVIATARSSTHIDSLARELFQLLREAGVRPLNRHRRTAASGWMLVDCGDVIVHLMERDQREFYDLEKLWFRAGRVPYSSKSS